MEKFIIEEMTSGEQQFYESIRFLENDLCKIIPNSLYKREEGGTNQIDFMILNTKGLFVIEFKDFKGWIHGHENSTMWTQTFSGGTKNQFRNPIKQNDNHIKTIKRLFVRFDISIPIYNLVVFSDSGGLQNISGTGVINSCDLNYELDKYPDIVYRGFQFKYIFEILEKERIKDPQAYAAHIEYAKSFSNTTELSSKRVKHIDPIPVFKTRRKATKRTRAYSKSKFPLLITLLLFSIIAKYNFFIDPTTTSLSSQENQANTGTVAVVNHNTDNNPILPEVNSNQSESLASADRTNETTAEPASEIPAPPEVTTEHNNDPIVSKSSIVTLHSDRSDVIEVLGTPDRIEETTVETLFYKNSWIALSDNKVIAWGNVLNQLDDFLPKPLTGAQPVFIGSTKENVMKALGAPTHIPFDNQNMYFYDNSHLAFDKNGYMVSYENKINQISSGLIKKKTNTKIIGIGSSRTEVLDRLGPPTMIRKTESDKYYYGSAYIQFNLNDMVIEYHNMLDEFNYDLARAIPNAPKIRIGATKQDVISALGAPTKITSSEPNKYIYDNSYILFNDQGNLIEYESKLKQLRLALQQADLYAPKIDIYSNREDVYNSLGGPTMIMASEPHKYYYEHAYIVFSDDWKVIGYENTLNAFRLGLHTRILNAPKFGLGSSKTDVLNALGGATSVKPDEPNKYFYKHSYVLFDDNDIVIDILNMFNQLNDYMIE